MGRQSQNKTIKRQKELGRMRKAKEKMEKRQCKKKMADEPDSVLPGEILEEIANNQDA